jgi:predicted CXXCH cytochrome family protein
MLTESIIPRVKQIFCHLPHDTPLEGDTRNLPLWNHALSTVIAFEVYGSGSAQADNDGHRLSADVSLGPGPVSLFCLSCHDGSVAVNRYGALPGSVFINGRYKIGGGGALTNMHPIGFSYAEVMDNDINKDPMLGTQPLGNLLWDGRMECPTCHDVHNSRNTGEKFLWVSDRHSDLCCSCHLICTR